MDPSSSLVASLALIAFVGLGFLVVATMPPVRAGLLIVLGASLFLPVNAGFDFPLIPPLGRRTLPGVILLLGVLLFWPNRARATKWGRVPDILLLVMTAIPVATAFLNSDTVRWGPVAIARLTPWDGVSAAVRVFLDVALPFYMGRVIFQRPEDLRKLLRWLVGAALIYSLGIMIELRMSPQLHNWVYGYHPNEFNYNIRWGGFRPMVFLPGGIAVGLFMLSTTLAAFGLGKLRERVWIFPARYAGVYLVLILVACKSVAAIVYSFVLVPFVALFGPRQIQRLALLMVCLVLFYPIFRSLDLVPTTYIVDTFASFSEDRAESLAERFENDERLLDRSMDRIFFGWGGHGRGRVLDEVTGIDITRSDGYWMILLTSGGLLAWACYYLVLLWPVMAATRRLGAFSKENQVVLSTVVLILALIAMDQLFNGFYLNMSFFISGGALTCLSQLPERSRSSAGVRSKEAPAARKKKKADRASGSLSGGLVGARRGARL